MPELDVVHLGLTPASPVSRRAFVSMAGVAAATLGLTVRNLAAPAVALGLDGIHPSELTRDHPSAASQKIYLEQWAYYNGPDYPFVRTYDTTLASILAPTGVGFWDWPEDWPWPPTQRDADVATAVIQWLGTNVGGGFIDSCEDRISKETGMNRIHRTIR